MADLHEITVGSMGSGLWWCALVDAPWLCLWESFRSLAVPFCWLAWPQGTSLDVLLMCLEEALVGQGGWCHLERCHGDPNYRPQLQRGCTKGHGQRDSLPETWLQMGLSLKTKTHGFCSEICSELVYFPKCWTVLSDSGQGGAWASWQLSCINFHP